MRRVKWEDYVWKKFWRLLIVWEWIHKPRIKDWVRYWTRYCVKCVCECGNEWNYQLELLRSWHTKSCWCLHIDKIKTHWFVKHRLYNIYLWINSRCNYKNNGSYNRYWLRWIKNLRNSFEEFKEDMYESYIKHVEEYWEGNTSIDRIDNNGNYCKENCKWSTRKEQQNNMSSNKFIYYKWEKYTISVFSEKFWVVKRVVRYYLSIWKDIEWILLNKFNLNVSHK